MLRAIEGIYKNGSIQLAEVPADISEGRVVVTFLEAESILLTGPMIHFSMFAGSNQSTENELQSAEFHGDSDDGLNWS